MNKDSTAMEKKMMVGSTVFTFDKDCGEYVGKLQVWGRETDVFLNTEHAEGDEVDKIVSEKINWIARNKEKIVKAFMEENDYCVDVVNEMIACGDFKADGPISADDFVNALFVNNVTIWVKGVDTDFALDLDAEPDYLFGHLAYMEIDSQYHVECGGLNG